MNDSIESVELLDDAKQTVAHLLAEAPSKYAGLSYADIRISMTSQRSALAECGKEKELRHDVALNAGIRVISGNANSRLGVKAQGFFGQNFGIVDLDDVASLLSEGLATAHVRASSSARQKEIFRESLPGLADSIVSSELAPVEIHQEIVPAAFDIDPDSISDGELMDLTREVSKEMMRRSPKVKFNVAEVTLQRTRDLFQSTEGANIDEGYALTQGLVYVVAGENGEASWDVIGDRRGYEVLHGVNPYGEDFRTFALRITDETVLLSSAPPLRIDPSKLYPVVTDPQYNALLVHEICGHPTEADRILKMETAYAGRSWFFGSFADNQIGHQVASPLISVAADPTIGGYGGYKYDAEGTLARRTLLIDEGKLVDFQNSRETANRLSSAFDGTAGGAPNGCMRAVNASYVPLVRMNNVVFLGGSYDPEKMISEIEDGFYVKGNKIPSISESRENFRITAKLVYKIENGKIGQLYRSGGITADSKDFLTSIDAVGNDFKNYPIPNCGKGAPMQAMKVGNGGPHLRGLARMTGVSSL
ncbi:MAG: TldD/PmbA family protein [Planctomycetes bacterium]|nr:TldD/PmbA family protein [Planctomycetota bacterium]